MVFFPMPFSLPSGPPTQFALSMKPWFIVLLSLLCLVVIARWATLDIFGGLFLLFAIIMGGYGVHDNMNITWISCLGIMFFMNAIIDTIVLIMRWWGYQAFSEYLPWYTRVINGLLVAGCVLQAVGAAMCWACYKKHIAPYEPEAPANYGSTSRGQSSSAASRNAFEGKGHRLGTREDA
eukprot:gnl/TRDRNA2_/TRDRNA2_184317_c0_seq1.p1 gnl/TRDRNA2_/TRDRNA2_184317_c0~~gnl/TRDRNA2_/TRDRNA2_184317_c0_seq1.p1  ORF type:complete len:179 (-),score=18.61 gnl/TRDRNA2_/TRDRNA2_184317_c0_seq1:111-647(-)